MGTGRTDEFRKDAVRIALTSGLSRRQVADDLGVGLSTLNKWVNAHRDTDVVSAEDRELTDLIVEETRRIVKLLEQVEQFGNVRPPEKKAVNLHDVLDRARKSAAVGYGLHMTILEDYDPSLPPTLGDADQLTQVFLNLLKNAAEAAKGEGTIRIQA